MNAHSTEKGSEHILRSVTVKNTDDSIAGLGGRVLGVRVSSSVSFETPIRPITSEEITSKSYLGYRGELQGQMAALPLYMGGQIFERFMKNNGTVKRIRDDLISHASSTFYLINYPILQMPPVAAGEKAEKIAYELQCYAPMLDYVTMPPLECNADIFEKRILNWCESADSIEDGRGCVPQLSFTEEPELFESKLKKIANLSKTGCINVVNIQYASPLTHPHQYAALWSMRDDLQALINCSAVPPKENELVPGMSYDMETQLLRYGIDSISRKKYPIPPKFIAKRNMEPPPSDLDNIDSFDYAVHPASIRIDSNKWMSMPHDTDCNCTVCRGRTRDELVDAFGYDDVGNISRSGLRYFSKMHDQQSDILELTSIRKYISSNNMRDYEERIKEEQSKYANAI